MDIPVSRLNQRMALQLPSELPLGMVFVVGIVEGKEELVDAAEFSYFYLAEKKFRIRCLISEHTTSDTDFDNGDRIRVGGQMAFDPQQAHYYILAREIDILADADEPGLSPSEILADIDRRSHESGLAPAELPIWVKQLAPPELMEELGISIPEEPEETESGESESGGDGAELFDPLRRKSAGTKLPMSEEMLAFLSGAIDSGDEVELTPDVIEHLAVPREPEKKVSARSVKPEVMESDSEWESASDDTSSWLADLEAINEVLDDEEGVSFARTIEFEAPHASDERHVPDSVDEVPTEETEAGNAELYHDALDTQIAVEKNGRGALEEKLSNEISDEPEIIDYIDGSYATDQDAEFNWEEQPRAASRKRSSIPWPEIAVVILIVIAVILSVAVVWVVAAR